MTNPKIGIIVSSTRQGRFADKPAQWIFDLASRRTDLQPELLDLRDYPMPFFDEVASPAWAPSKNEVAQRWQQKIAEKDGFVFITAEYNRSITAALKNAIDYAYPQWNRKAAGYVGYGSVGGARAIEQLRQISVELQLAPTRTGVHIQWPVYLAVGQEGKSLSEFDFLNQNATDMLDQLVWWSNALKAARESEVRTAVAA